MAASVAVGCFLVGKSHDVAILIAGRVEKWYSQYVFCNQKWRLIWRFHTRSYVALNLVNKEIGIMVSEYRGLL